MRSESRIWEIRPFGSMRGGNELVIGSCLSIQPSRLLYERARHELHEFAPTREFQFRLILSLLLIRVNRCPSVVTSIRRLVAPWMVTLLRLYAFWNARARNRKSTIFHS